MGPLVSMWLCMAVHFCCCLSLLHDSERTSEKMEGCADALVCVRAHTCMSMFVCVFVCVCVCVRMSVLHLCMHIIYLWLAVPPSTKFDMILLFL